MGKNFRFGGILGSGKNFGQASSKFKGKQVLSSRASSEFKGKFKVLTLRACSKFKGKQILSLRANNI